MKESSLSEGNGQITKEPLHVTISVPSSNDRRVKWIRDKIQLKNPGMNDAVKNNVSDSGFLGDSLPGINSANKFAENNNTHDEPPFSCSKKNGLAFGYK